MNRFIIARVTGETLLDYLCEDGYRWVDSPAAAKSYPSEKEAEEDREHQAHMEPGSLQVLAYDSAERI